MALERILGLVAVLSLAQICTGESGRLSKRELSLRHNAQLLDYLMNNSENIYETIVRDDPGSTELFSEVVRTMLTSTTQAWFRCSRKFNVEREIFFNNIVRYQAYTNQQELCAKSCFLEESRMMVNGKLDPAMMSMIMIMAYGDDRDIHNYSKDLVKSCNQQLPSADHNTCSSGHYLDCYVKGLKHANIYIPQQILNEYRSPHTYELTSR